jgi:hypothetical protein
MATYNNDLRLKEIATGDESGTWGTSTNANLGLVADALSYGTKQMSADADETFTMPNATADGTRSLYLRITSAVSLTGTRAITLGPNTVSKVWVIENATTGSQSITIKQGSGSTVTVATGAKVMVYSDGAGAGASVVNANPTASSSGTVTSVAVTGTVNGITLTGGPVTSTGTFTLGGALSGVNLASQVTGTLPVANGGTGATSIAANNVILGNGTSAVQVVAPGTSGNVLKSTGSSWASAAEAAGYPAPSLTGVSLTATSASFIVATAGSITITLPASPSAGDFVVVKDGTGAAATTTFSVARNGSNIASSATDLTFDKNFAEIVMTYINGTIGWSV